MAEVEIPLEMREPHGAGCRKVAGGDVQTDLDGPDGAGRQRELIVTSLKKAKENAAYLMNLSLLVTTLGIFCDYYKSKRETKDLVMLILAVLSLILQVVLFCLLWYSRHVARRGDIRRAGWLDDCILGAVFCIIMLTSTLQLMIR